MNKIIHFKEFTFKKSNENNDNKSYLKYDKQNIDSYYKWILGENEKCEKCIEYSKMLPKTLKEWASISIPGVPSGVEIASGLKTNYSKENEHYSECENTCNCKLEMVGAASYIGKKTKGFIGPQ